MDDKRGKGQIFLPSGMLEEFDPEQWKKDHYKRHPKSLITVRIIYIVGTLVLLWLTWRLLHREGLI